MSYRVGQHELKIGRELIGRKVVVLEELKNNNGDRFPEGTEMKIRQVWRGKATLDDRGVCISGVSGRSFWLLPVEVTT